MPNNYTLRDWETDWHWISDFEKAHPGQKGPTDEQRSQIVAYFDRKYRADADHHRDRLLQAREYAYQNRDGLDEGRLAIAGKDKSITGYPLRAALYQLYGNCIEQNLSFAHKPQDILRLARQIEQALNRQNQRPPQ
jgi:hypothetical protein